MSKLLSTLGLVVIAGWVLLLLARERFGRETVTIPPHLLEIGLALVAAGLLLGFVLRARGVVARPRCGRCGKPIARGETYCAQHFRETVDKMRDASRK